MYLRLLLVALAAVALTACASEHASPLSAHIADAVPQWLGGMPPDVPPRPGTTEYEVWQAERAKEAARPKTVKP